MYLCLLAWAKVPGGRFAAFYGLFADKRPSALRFYPTGKSFTLFPFGELRKTTRLEEK